MLDDKTIQPAVARLVAAAMSPSQVILFGSYARGMAHEGPELNRLVIERDLSSKATVAQDGRCRVGVSFRRDVAS